MMSRTTPQRVVHPAPPPEVVVLGPAPCQSCRLPVYWGYSFGWSHTWGTGRIAIRDWRTGSGHGCTTVRAA
jgi:hypothetical protein